jgi:hypothetical protein
MASILLVSKTIVIFLSEKALYETPTIKNKQKVSAKAAGLNQFIEDFGGSTIRPISTTRLSSVDPLFRREFMYPGRFSRLIGGLLFM